MWFWPGTQVFKENWWNTLWSSSTSSAYLFPFPFLSYKLSFHTTDVSHLFSVLHTCLLSIQSPDLHHNFSHLHIYVFSPFDTVTWIFLFKKQIHLNPATSLITVFLPLPPLSSHRFEYTMFVSGFSVLILVQKSFHINVLSPTLQWNCGFALTFS